MVDRGDGRMGLTLNSKIEDLILAIGELIVAPDGKTTKAMLVIPDQNFCLEITVKPKKEKQKNGTNQTIY